MPAPTIADRAFRDADGNPRLCRSAVAFLDLLGVRNVSRKEPEEGLRRLDLATRHMFRDFLAPDSPWPTAFFSDTLVLTSPLIGAEADEESALGGLIVQIAYLQLNLIQADWFLRGGLTIGDVHMREGLVYGPALIDAYELESGAAIYPRIILSQTAIESQRAALKRDATAADSSENTLLLRDDDGLVFVHYLALLFDEPDDPRPRIALHRDRVTKQLDQHRASRRVWEKYRWVAEYHNHTCRQFLPDAGDLLIPAVKSSSHFHAFVEAK